MVKGSGFVLQINNNRSITLRYSPMLINSIDTIVLGH